MSESSLLSSSRGGLRWRRWNVANILIFEFLWGFAVAISNQATVVTGYIESLGYSQIVVGLAPGLYWACYSILQPFTFHLVRPGKHLFGKVVGVFLLSSLAYVAMGLMALAPGFSALFKLLSLLSCMIAFVALLGLGDPYFFAILYTTVPPHQRGRFFGWRAFCYGFGGWCGSSALAFIFEKQSSGTRFGTAFIVTGVVLFVAVLWFALYRLESVDLLPPAPTRKVVPHLRQLCGRVARNRPLMVYLTTNMLFIACLTGGYPLYAGQIRRYLGADEQILARLTQASWLGILLFGPFMGWFADRFGYRRTSILVYLLFCLGTGLMLAPDHSFGLYAFAYFLVSCALPGMSVAGLNLGQECGPDFQPAETMIVMQVSLLPVRLGSPLLIGSILDAGYPSRAFGFCMALTLAGATVLIFLLGPLLGRRPPVTTAPDAE